MNVLTPTEIERLLSWETISERWPWNSNDEATIDRFHKEVVAEICRTCSLKDRSEWNHYGSGYASYVDAWFYRETPAFHSGPRNQYRGLVVLLSRLAPAYVLGEAEKSWHSHGGVSYMPHLDFVDRIKSPAVVELIEPVSAILKARGMTRLFRQDLIYPLETKKRVPTILSDPPFTHFDALFHWED